MEGIGWASFLLVGRIAGWIAEKVMSRSHGLLTSDRFNRNRLSQ